MASTVITAIVSFASTNIDDIFVLMLFFVQINACDKQKKHFIMIGQYLGVAILIAISVLGAFGLRLIPKQYIGLLGIIPIMIGVRSWIAYKKEDRAAVNGKERSSEPGQDNREKSADRFHEKSQHITNKVQAYMTKIMRPEIATVMLMTIANGADNISVYIPLFSSYSLLQLVIAIVIFMLMIPLWCHLGCQLASYPVVKEKVKKYEHVVVPLVFIFWGIFIILESGLLLGWLA